MKAINLLAYMLLIPLVITLFQAYYGINDIYPNTMAKVQPVIENIKTSISRVNPNNSLLDIMGGMFGSVISLFAFIFDIPTIIAVFIGETAGYLGLGFISLFLESITYILVLGIYIYYGMVVLGWLNTNFINSNKI